MKGMQEIIENIINRLLPSRAFPELAIVKKVYEGAGKGKYCIDVEVVLPGSLEKTGELITEVPISPIWAGKNKQGIYCLPDTDMLVVIGFLKGNKGFPFVECVYGNTYETADFQKEAFLLTDGENIEIKIKEGKYSVTNGDNVKQEILDDQISASVGNGTKIEIKDGKITVQTDQGKIVVDDKIEIGTTKTLKDLFDDIWDAIELVNDNIGNLDTSLSGLQVKGAGFDQLVDTHAAIFTPLDAATVAQLKAKKINYGFVLK